MQPRGLGALQMAFERLRQKLAEEGLFDPEHKKPLPLLPRRIGIVTSPTGAAIRDILNVIHRRFGNVHILLYPARVQGDEAAPEIVEGIRTLDALGVDVMIVGRGGGSIEDLWPFNEEAVVRAVHAAKTPIISAVGHEIDVTLTDFAADLRAPTPSAAAELVVKEQETLYRRIVHARDQAAKLMLRRLEQFRHRLKVAESCYALKRPEDLIRQRRQMTDDLRMRMQAMLLAQVTVRRTRLERASRAIVLTSPATQIHRARERFSRLHQRLGYATLSRLQRARSRMGPLLAHLDALSPLAILSRGYALAWKMPEKTLVREAGQLAPGDSLFLRFGSGSATASVERVRQGRTGIGRGDRGFESGARHRGPRRNRRSRTGQRMNAMSECNFEKDLEKLEEIVAALEEGGLSLDDSLKHFELGVKLARRCEKALTEAEKKIEVLTKKANGEIVAEPFEEGEERAAPKGKGDDAAPARKRRGEAAESNGTDDDEDEDSGAMLF
jgi:exodeoxyribonuclease VII large subunit